MSEERLRNPQIEKKTREKKPLRYRGRSATRKGGRRSYLLVRRAIKKVRISVANIEEPHQGGGLPRCGSTKATGAPLPSLGVTWCFRMGKERCFGGAAGFAVGG